MKDPDIPNKEKNYIITPAQDADFLLALGLLGKNGEIRFLEIEGSSNPQIRECIRKAFALAFPSRFQRPPNGDAFTGRLDGIEFLAQ